MNNHKHIFEHIGGGTNLVEKDKQWMCDDHYKCECGTEFKLKTSLEGHTYLPRQIYGDEPSEAKTLELQETNRILDNQY